MSEEINTYYHETYIVLQAKRECILELLAWIVRQTKNYYLSIFMIVENRDRHLKNYNKFYHLLVVVKYNLF